MHNILATGRLGALFVIPGRTDLDRSTDRAQQVSSPSASTRHGGYATGGRIAAACVGPWSIARPHLALL